MAIQSAPWRFGSSAPRLPSLFITRLNKPKLFKKQKLRKRKLVPDGSKRLVLSPSGTHAIHHHCKQNDAPLDRLFPIWLNVQVRQRGTDTREEQETDEYAPKIAPPTGDGHTTHHASGNHLEFEARPGLRIHLRRLDNVHDRRE